jgi:hypothetical protein
MKPRSTAIITSAILIVLCAFTFAGKKPGATFAGKTKGNIDKLAFIGAKKLELQNNSDNAWQITGYEFDCSCGGKVSMKYYRTDSIPTEIILQVKNCDDPAFITDFTNIKARNKKTGKEISLNNIHLNVLR